MDKKSKKILMHYMDDTKRKLLSFEEIAYAKEHGAILEDLSISHEEAIRILTQSLKCISLSDAANSFLYSLSTRDMEYRYILASYVYAVSWLMFDGGRTDKVPSRLDRTFYNWVKYQGGGIWGGIGKPIFYLNEFAHMDKQTPTSTDKNILKEIISISSVMSDHATGIMLCKSSTDFLIIFSYLRKCWKGLLYQTFPAFCVSEDTPHIMAFRSLIWHWKVVKP